MKFLHTADWHVGRKLHGYDLSTEQADALRKLEKIAIDEKVDAIVIAGCQAKIPFGWSTGRLKN